jgi:hypothetical protein
MTGLPTVKIEEMEISNSISYARSSSGWGGIIQKYEVDKSGTNNSETTRLEDKGYRTFVPICKKCGKSSAMSSIISARQRK